MDDLMIQFARLWGQREATLNSSKDEDISYMLKGFDSVDMEIELRKWKDEFLSLEDVEDTVEFFEKKIEELYLAEQEGR